MIFLLEYDRRRGCLVSRRVFTDAEYEKAAEARFELELELRARNVDHEVVILEAPSEAALRVTHRRYFQNLEELAKSLSETSR